MTSTRGARRATRRPSTSSPASPATSAGRRPPPACRAPSCSRSWASTKSPDYGYYVAKLAQERAAREAAPGRAGAARDPVPRLRPADVRVEPRRRRHPVIDVPTQPVDTTEIVRLLLDLATGTVDHDVELAGPEARAAGRPRGAVRRAHRLRRDRRAGRRARRASRRERCCPTTTASCSAGIDWQTWLERQPGVARATVTRQPRTTLTTAATVSALLFACADTTRTAKVRLLPGSALLSLVTTTVRVADSPGSRAAV